MPFSAEAQARITKAEEDAEADHKAGNIECYKQVVGIQPAFQPTAASIEVSIYIAAYCRWLAANKLPLPAGVGTSGYSQ